jgi:hypothetical protein
MKLALIFLLLAGSAGAQMPAQSLPFKPLPTVRVKLTDGNRTWYEPLTVPHKTTDGRFLAFLAVSSVLTVADVENSVAALKKPGTSEANGIFGAHPGRGTYYAITLPMLAGTAYLSYRWKREDDALAYAGLPRHKFVKWWLPLAVNTGAHVAGVIATTVGTGR